MQRYKIVHRTYYNFSAPVALDVGDCVGTCQKLR